MFYISIFLKLVQIISLIWSNSSALLDKSFNCVLVAAAAAAYDGIRALSESGVGAFAFANKMKMDEACLKPGNQVFNVNKKNFNL